MAVVGRVVAVIIDSVNAMIFRRSFPHVGEKILKDFPSLTSFNTAASVVFIIGDFWIGAALSYPFPSFVFGRVLHAMCFVRSLFSQAAATFCIAASEITAGLYDFVAAVASTFPKRLFKAVCANALNNRKPLKSFISQIAEITGAAMEKAATATYDTVAKLGTANYFTFPAITFAEPVCSIFAYIFKCDDDQPAEPQADHVLKIRCSFHVCNVTYPSAVL